MLLHICVKHGEKNANEYLSNNSKVRGREMILKKTCEMCKNKFHLYEHQMGLVFNDKFFICQDCQTHKSNQEIIEWTQGVMRRLEFGMPISLWLINEQNKDEQPFIGT
jgi:hypothetical protein